MFQRPAAHREQPAHRLEAEDLALVIQADVLQVVEQPPLGRPEPSGGLAEQGRQRRDPEAGLALLDEERLLQSHREPSDRRPGRGPLGLTRVRPGPHRRPRPEDRRADGIPALGGRPRPRRQPMESGTHPGVPRPTSVDAAAGGSDPSARLDGHLRFRRAGRPGRGEEGPRRRGPGPAPPRSWPGTRSPGRQSDRRRWLEARQLEEHRRERRVSRPVGGRGQQQAILRERIAGLLELGAADRRDPRPSPGSSICPDSNCAPEVGPDARRATSRRQTVVKTTPGSAFASSSVSGRSITSAVEGHPASAGRPSSGPSTMRPERRARGSHSISDASRPAIGVRGRPGSPDAGSGPGQGPPPGRRPRRCAGVRRV